MKIDQDTVVNLKYTLTDDQGEIIDSSEDEPFAYLHGHGQLVGGLEKELQGKTAGDKLHVVVSPADAYGEQDDGQVLDVSREELPEELEPEVGQELSYEGDDGELVSMWVVEVGETHVKLDGNHPLAGQTLTFDVEIQAVRKADASEIEHGHPHEDDDHHGHGDMQGPYTH